MNLIHEDYLFSGKELRFLEIRTRFSKLLILKTVLYNVLHHQALSYIRSSPSQIKFVENLCSTIFFIIIIIFKAKKSRYLQTTDFCDF